MSLKSRLYDIVILAVLPIMTQKMIKGVSHEPTRYWTESRRTSAE